MRVQIVKVTALGLLVLGCGGKDGDPAHAQDRHHPAGSIRITRFTAEPAVVKPGAIAFLLGDFNLGRGEVDQGVGALHSGQPAQVSPRTTTTYTLTVTLGPDRVVKRSVTLRVQPSATDPAPKGTDLPDHAKLPPWGVQEPLKPRR